MIRDDFRDVKIARSKDVILCVRMVKIRTDGHFSSLSCFSNLSQLFKKFASTCPSVGWLVGGEGEHGVSRSTYPN